MTKDEGNVADRRFSAAYWRWKFVRWSGGSFSIAEVSLGLFGMVRMLNYLFVPVTFSESDISKREQRFYSNQNQKKAENVWVVKTS